MRAASLKPRPSLLLKLAPVPDCRPAEPIDARTYPMWGFCGAPAAPAPPTWRPSHYIFALLVMVTGGLAAGLLYRGPRWPELVATVVLFVGFYHLYDYRAESSGIVKQLILAPRFLVPLLPVLAFALAEVVPRTWRTLEARFLDRSDGDHWRRDARANEAHIQSFELVAIRERGSKPRTNAVAVGAISIE